MTAKLGDHFSLPEKQQYIFRNLKIGSVLKDKVTDTTPSKEKRFIIIGINESEGLVGIVFINTEINPKVFPSRELQNLHVFFSHQNRDYLDHDSYVDCSRIYDKDIKMIQNRLIDDIERLFGQLSEDDLQIILTKIQSSRTISNKQKLRYGLNLSDYH